jgi:hypothetical protein
MANVYLQESLCDFASFVPLREIPLCEGFTQRREGNEDFMRILNLIANVYLQESLCDFASFVPLREIPLREIPLREIPLSEILYFGIMLTGSINSNTFMLPGASRSVSSR